MSDQAQTKAAKKNAKRREAKKKKAAAEGGGRQTEQLEPQDMLIILKDQLEEAKAAKDHQLMGTLRDQIWVLSDLIKGVRTNIPDDELLPIIERINKTTSSSSDSTPGGASAAPTSQSVPSSLTPEERKIRGLKKKLQQIETLRERQKKGESLEQSQLDKIASEDKILEEIDELETLIADALTLSR